MKKFDRESSLDDLAPRGLARLATGRWAHISHRRQTTWLRYIGGDDEAALANDSTQLANLLDGADYYEARELVDPGTNRPATSISHMEHEAWTRIADGIPSGTSCVGASGQPSLINEPGRKTIPITSLRHFYTSLRLLSVDDVHLAISKYLARRPDGLLEMVVSSIEHVARSYRNDEAFVERGTERDEDEEPFARACVRELLRLETWTGHPDLGFRYVEREVSPLRTTGGRYETGVAGSRSGHGGIDVLLASSDGLPIVGEVKAATDTNAFLALIQALTYAVELVSGPQRERLEKWYAGHFPGLGARTLGPYVDIYLFMQKEGARQSHTRYEPLVEQLAAALIRQASPLREHVRRIAMLEVDGTADLTVRWWRS